MVKIRALKYITTRTFLQRYQSSEGVYNLSTLDNPEFPECLGCAERYS